MKTLMILRHAKSSWKEPGLADHDRPLNKRGQRDAPRMGQLIKKQRIVPELIFCSTANRAATTARVVAEHAGYKGEIVFEPNLYLAPPSTYIEQLSLLPLETQRVMMVGHNPGLAELLYLTTNENRDFPTAALAEVAWDVDSWGDVVECIREGTLNNFWIPKEQD